MGITVKEIRTDVLKMTQEELSQKLCITKSAYCRKEKGSRRFTWKEIVTLCKLSNVNPLDIFLP